MEESEEKRQEELVSSSVTSCNEQLITMVHCAIRPTLTSRLNVTSYMKT